MSEIRKVLSDDAARIGACLELPSRSGWRLHAWKAKPDHLDAHYVGRGGAWAMLRLLAADRRVPEKLRGPVLAEVQVAILRRSPQAELAPLFAALEAALAAQGGLPWVELEPPEPEPEPEHRRQTPAEVGVDHMAFEAGLKPALRMRHDLIDTCFQANWWLRAGASICVVEGKFDGELTGWTMVARSRAQAESLAQAELDQFGPMGLPRERAPIRLGELLGYPRCCVEAFIAKASIERDGRGVPHDDFGNWLRFEQAWVPRPVHLLNNLRAFEQISLIAFSPCRYDCEAATALARKIAELVAPVCPEYEDELRCVVAVDEHDHRLELELDDERRIRATRTIGPEDPAVTAFGEALLGRRVDDEGRVPGADRRCRVLDFR